MKGPRNCGAGLFSVTTIFGTSRSQYHRRLEQAWETPPLPQKASRLSPAAVPVGTPPGAPSHSTGYWSYALWKHLRCSVWIAVAYFRRRNWRIKLSAFQGPLPWTLANARRQTLGSGLRLNQHRHTELQATIQCTNG